MHACMQKLRHTLFKASGIDKFSGPQTSSIQKQIVQNVQDIPYLDIGMKIIMLPNSVLATILLWDKSVIALPTSQPLKTSSAGSLYENEPYKKRFRSRTQAAWKNATNTTIYNLFNAVSSRKTARNNILHSKFGLMPKDSTLHR